MAYTPTFSQGVKFIKIARVDDQGKDNTLSLQELDSIRIDYSDTDIIEYPIVSIAKYDNSNYVLKPHKKYSLSCSFSEFWIY